MFAHYSCMGWGSSILPELATLGSPQSAVDCNKSIGTIHQSEND